MKSPEFTGTIAGLKPVASLIVPLSLYTAVAAIVFVLHGTEPPFSMDHIAYIKQTNEILRENPDGHYIRALSATKSYGVLLAYLHHATADHILSLKVVLFAVTILYLGSFDLLWSLFSAERWRRIMFSLLSAMHVSFGGAVFWGVTDFTASLNRTLVIPLMLVLLWVFWRDRLSLVRFLVLPALVYASLLHMSTLYLLAVLTLTEAVRAVARMRHQKSLDKQSFAFVVAVVLAFGAVAHLTHVGLLGFNTSWITLKVESPKPVVENPKPSAESLTASEAWEIERFAQPWRNFPPRPVTLLNAGGSLGLIAILVALGVRNRWRRGMEDVDWLMLQFGACIVVFAIGPQFGLWLLSKVVPLYPMNYEEIRAIKFLIIPSLYFVSRLFDALWDGEPGLKRSRGRAVLTVGICLAQPVILVRALPVAAREGIFSAAVAAGSLDPWPSQRTLYARQVLRLDEGGPRYYYSARGVLAWLSTHAAKDDRILTNRDELYVLDARVVGTSNGFLGLWLDSSERRTWQRTVKELNSAISARDMRSVIKIACEVKADFIVVPWFVQGSAYSDAHFSIMRTPACQ